MYNTGPFPQLLTTVAEFLMQPQLVGLANPRSSERIIKFSESELLAPSECCGLPLGTDNKDQPWYRYPPCLCWETARVQEPRRKQGHHELVS